MVVLGRALADRQDRLDEMLRAAVVEIVAVDRGDDDMLEAELGDRIGDVLRLVRIERAGHAGAHIAEGAGTRAGVAHDHHGGVFLRPALADIGAAGLLAHGDQAVRLDDLARFLIDRRSAGANAYPVRLAQIPHCRAGGPFPDGAALGSQPKRCRER